jgi:hypothetical protein
LLNEPLVLGDRLIVHSSPRSSPPLAGGLAWISPAQAEARIAWPYAHDIDRRKA